MMARRPDDFDAALADIDRLRVRTLDLAAADPVGFALQTQARPEEVLARLSVIEHDFRVERARRLAAAFNPIDRNIYVDALSAVRAKMTDLRAFAMDLHTRNPSVFEAVFAQTLPQFVAQNEALTADVDQKLELARERGAE